MRKYSLFLSIALLAGTVAPLAGGSVKCRAKKIDGFESEHTRAEQVIGHQTTSNVADIRIYLTRKKTPTGYDVYAHSNYISSGAPYATKIAVDDGEIKNIGLLLGNIVYKSDSDFQIDYLGTAQAIKKNIKFFVDDLFFNVDGVPAIDLKEAASIHYVDASNKSVRLIRRSGSDPPPYMAELTKTLRAKFKPGRSPSALMSRFKSTVITGDNLSFLNLIEETAVESAISQTPIAARAATKTMPISEQGIFDAIRAQRNKVLVALFHCDGNNLVVESPSGGAQVKIPLDKLSKVAQEANCTLVALGCGSGQGQSGAGVMESFNPVEAVRLLNDSLGAGSFAEFAQKFTDNTLHLVFDEDRLAPAVAFEGYQLEATNKTIPRPKPSFVGVVTLAVPANNNVISPSPGNPNSAQR